MRIEIDEKTVRGLLKLCNRYYFDLFKEIRVNKDEEFEMRNALFKIVEKIDEKLEKKL